MFSGERGKSRKGHRSWDAPRAATWNPSNGEANVATVGRARGSWSVGLVERVRKRTQTQSDEYRLKRHQPSAERGQSGADHTRREWQAAEDGRRDGTCRRQRTEFGPVFDSYLHCPFTLFRFSTTGQSVDVRLCRA